MASFRINGGVDRIYVDDDVLAEVEQGKWSGGRTRSIQRSTWQQGRSVKETLAEVVMGERAPRGYVWAHLDDDWRNFRRENLQLRPRGQHLNDLPEEARKERASKAGKIGGARGGRGRRTNATGLVGVHPAGKQFKAMATVDGKQTYLGLFATPEEAALAYDWALERQGLEAVNRVGGELSPEVIRRLEARVA